MPVGNRWTLSRIAALVGFQYSSSLSFSLSLSLCSGGVQALVLLSTRCRSDCNGSKVTLEPRWRLFGDQTNISRAVFFDLEEDVRVA